jgi:hypothetical protein
MKVDRITEDKLNNERIKNLIPKNKSKKDIQNEKEDDLSQKLADKTQKVKNKNKSNAKEKAKKISKNKEDENIEEI